MLKKRLGAECIERKWWSNRNLKDYFKITSPLTIPSGCERIGVCAFWCCHALKKVKISESVKVIGEDAFWKCWRAVVILRKPVSEFKGIEEDALFWCDILVEEKNVKEEVRN